MVATINKLFSAVILILFATVCGADDNFLKSLNNFSATPLNPKVERIVGAMKIQPDKITFTNLRGFLRIKEQSELYESDGIFRVYEIENFDEMLKVDIKYKYFCPKISNYMLLKDLGDELIRVIFINKDIQFFKSERNTISCSETTFSVDSQ